LLVIRRGSGIQGSNKIILIYIGTVVRMSYVVEKRAVQIIIL